MHGRVYFKLRSETLLIIPSLCVAVSSLALSQLSRNCLEDPIDFWRGPHAVAMYPAVSVINPFVDYFCDSA